MISVIVPGYNVQGTLGACLEALLDQTVPRDRYEIIYVDDASTAGSVEVARRYPGVALIRLEANRGQANARNVGLAQSKGEIILFTDADCVPARDWIEAMLQAFADDRVHEFAHGRVEPHGPAVARQPGRGRHRLSAHEEHA